MKRSAFAALGGGALGGLQWRILLLWILVTLLPTLVVALPLWATLDKLLGYNVHAESYAAHFNGLMFGDVFGSLQRDNPWTGMAFIAGVLLTLAVSPFLTGMVVAGGRAGRALSFGALLQGGATEYGRMLRLLLLSLVPYALFAMAMHGFQSFADDKADAAVLESSADTWAHLALAFTLLVFVIVQCVVESARAAYIADITLRSAFRALGRGFMQFVRRPFATLLVYLVITLVGAVLAVLIASWRGHTTAVGTGTWVAFAIVQLGVVVVAWMRTARLLALSRLANVNAHRRRRTDFAPAL
ncbi:hypothetical protein L2Y96_15060 [Luteibacter aegosomaticola]|uniref:hypothetical protein n=1 Tax=Luteibacter aegosomaticola TaxID=2911538 RepID=UPI001FF8C5A7|nr:hypothetical protein [Luteibacter aegosomaticola]UPG88722.1 hypothetical protein L2Y96_15060 [Luteibacter aegosomaticola]